jgi:phospholipase C
VVPTGANSDHARINDGGGPSWVAAIVNAIGNSNTCDNNTGYWKNTAILITWDDWGGWYDHEPPTILGYPQGGYQYGFRVPLLFVSAYTPKGYVNNNRHDFGSILRFVEHDFGIQEGSLNFADARADNALTTFFDLNRPPRAFQRILAPKDANFFLNDKRIPTDPDDDQ